MADHRMLSRDFLMSDTALCLSSGAKLLYVYLNVNADDEGFLNNPKLIMRICDVPEEYFVELVKNGFILQFESGVVVIRHWLYHNKLNKEKRRKTNNIAERPQILVYAKTRIYVLASDAALYREGELLTLDEVDDESDGPKHTSYGAFDNVLLTDKEYCKLRAEFHADYEERIDRLSEYMENTGKQYKNHYSVIRRWAKDDQAKGADSRNPFLNLAGGSYD